MNIVVIDINKDYECSQRIKVPLGYRVWQDIVSVERY